MEVSIIIPVYNKRIYVETLLQMVANQSFHDFECLLIDDGSTDGSEMICDRFAGTDERFRVFHVTNGGVSRARNIGLDNAKGKYITFIDADDEITQDYIGELYEVIEKTGVDLVICGHTNIWDGSSKREPKIPPYADKKLKMSELMPEFAKKQSTSGIYGWCCTKMIPRDMIGSIRFKEGLKLAEDFDFYLGLYPSIQTVYFSSNCNYRYRQEAQNGSVSKNDEDIDYLSQLQLNLKYRDSLQEMNAWSGENKTIVEKKINDYVYFTLFHAPMSDFGDRFDKARAIWEQDQFALTPGNWMARVLFVCLKANKKSTAKAVMELYRFGRRMVRHYGSLFVHSIYTNI